MENTYLSKINPVFEDELLISLRDIAQNNQIPIMTEDGIHFLVQLLKIKNAKRVLEIGTAIGYSAICIAKYTDAFVVSIERNEDMFQKATQNIEKANLGHKIEVLLKDALDVDNISLGKFDLIFIDAAKSQYIKFFEKFENNLNENGVIITDNLLFRGQVQDDSKIISRNRHQLVGKIRKYNEWIVQNPNYDTYLYEIGDGIAVSIKK